jgi:hypothetical protein
VELIPRWSESAEHDLGAPLLRYGDKTQQVIENKQLQVHKGDRNKKCYGNSKYSIILKKIVGWNKASLV